MAGEMIANVRIRKTIRTQWSKYRERHIDTSRFIVSSHDGKIDAAFIG
jgi:hypothetical protein